LREVPEHDTDHCEADERGNRCGVTFEIAGSLYDLQLPRSGAPDCERHLFTGIAAVSKDALDKWKRSSRPAQQLKCSITVLNIGRMNDDVPGCRPPCHGSECAV
jgi:hypothetical protein